MDYSVLVGLDIDLGRQIIDALEKSNLKLVVGAWATLSEYEDPRLILALKELPRKGGVSVQDEVFSILHQEKLSKFLPPLLIYRVADPFIKALRQTFGGSKDCRVEPSRTIGGKFIEDMYIYNMQK